MLPRRLDTGFPTADAQYDFTRVRRQRVLAQLATRLRGEASDVNLILPFEEVVEALGRVGERYVGLAAIPLDSIVGTVDRARDFDRSFRPTSTRTRPRWERIAGALRRGESMPPISVYRIGELHFVRDGHHRVSVARALGWETIDGYVTEVLTKVGADGQIRLRDLPLKSHERLFFERVPLPPAVRGQIRLRDPWGYPQLAEGVEAWGFRVMQGRGEFMSREQVAEAWYRDEYRPVVAMIKEAGLFDDDATDAEAYMRVTAERYRLMRTHDWNDEVIERLRESLT